LRRHPGRPRAYPPRVSPKFLTLDYPDTPGEHADNATRWPIATAGRFGHPCIILSGSLSPCTLGPSRTPTAPLRGVPCGGILDCPTLRVRCSATRKTRGSSHPNGPTCRYCTSEELLALVWIDTFGGSWAGRPPRRPPAARETAQRGPLARSCDLFQTCGSGPDRQRL